MAKKIEGKTLAIGFLAVVVGFAGLVFWIGLTGGSKHVPRSAPGVGFSATPAPPGAPHEAADAGHAADSGATR